jgi:hypothetical protein
MKRTFLVLTAALATVAFAPRANAQGTNKMSTPTTAPKSETASVAVALPESTTVDTVKKTVVAKRKMSFLSTAPGVQMQNYRPEDKRGINVFEAPKDEGIGYDGFKLQFSSPQLASRPIRIS